MQKKLINYSKKKKTITVEELSSMCVETDNFREKIYRLIEDGTISPVKTSGTDGNLSRPLYKKYRINITEEKTDYTAEIHRLHPRLIANGYLKRKPGEYEKHRSIITKLDKYLSRENDSVKMSRRERSLVIFGNEKILDKNPDFIRSLGFSPDELGYYVTPEECFCDYIPVRKNDMVLLICENKDIWFNIRRLMFENNCCELFGQHIDGVIYGQGNAINGKGKFTAYAEFLGVDNVKFLYCGDIDRAGFDIFFRLESEAETLNIQLFREIYIRMLDLCDIEILPDSEDGRNISVDMNKIKELFSEDCFSKINLILDKNKRLPQEIINMKVLQENMK